MEIRPAAADDLEPLGALFASERGFSAAGEDTVQRLYKRLGYTGWGHGHTVASWRERRSDGARSL